MADKYILIYNNILMNERSRKRQKKFVSYVIFYLIIFGRNNTNKTGFCSPISQLN